MGSYAQICEQKAGLRGRGRKHGSAPPLRRHAGDSHEPAAEAPGVRSGKALEVQGTYVVLRGWVDPRGQVTTYYFQLGTTTSYGIAPELNEELLSGNRGEQVYEAIPQLRHRTTYHFRLVAHSRGGTTYGKDKTFRTLGPAAP